MRRDGTCLYGVPFNVFMHGARLSGCKGDCPNFASRLQPGPAAGLCSAIKTAPQTNFPPSARGTPSLSQTHVPRERLDALSLQQATTESNDKRSPLLLTRLPIRTTEKRRWRAEAVMSYFADLSEITLQRSQERRVVQEIG